MKMVFRHTAVALLVFVSIISMPVLADAQSESWRTNPPVVIALDGIQQWATVIPGVGPQRIMPYLAPALKAVWGELTVEELPWGGQLSDVESLNNYKELAKTFITLYAQRYPQRPRVVIAHSWGSVVAYQALLELAEQYLDSNQARVDFLITIGSPLASTSDTVKEKLLLHNTLYGTAPGSEYVLSSQLVKPLTSARWINFWIEEDEYSKGLKAPAENRRLHYTGNIASHSAYFDYKPFVTQLLMTDGTGIPCINSYGPRTGVPAGYGAAYNVASDREVNLQATCTSASVLLTAGTGSPAEAQQRVYRSGYQWKDGQWQQITFARIPFSGPDTGGDWINGMAQAVVTPGQLTDYNNVVAYVCTWTNQWKCGCRDNACGTSYWQLQSFRAEGGSW